MNKPITDETREELLDGLRDAQAKVFEAIQILEDYCRVTGDSHTESYLLATLCTAASEESGYITRDQNFDDVIRDLDLGLNDGDDEDEEEVA